MKVLSLQACSDLMAYARLRGMTLFENEQHHFKFCKPSSRVQAKIAELTGIKNSLQTSIHCFGQDDYCGTHVDQFEGAFTTVYRLSNESTFRFEIDYEEVIERPGAFTLMPPEVVHSVNKGVDTRWSLVICHRLEVRNVN